MHRVMSSSLTIGEFKARLPEALARVRRGEVVTVTYGRSRKPVAVLGPPPARAPRKLGILKGKVRVTVQRDWELTDESLLGA